MMIVLLIISVLILVAIPNVTKHSATIDDKGCSAYLRMLEGQIEAFKIENKKVPTTDELAEYINSEGMALTCPNGKPLEIKDGKVQQVNANSGT